MNEPRKESDRVAHALAQDIISAFEEPDNWPMDDSSRIEALRAFYKHAKQVEYLIKQGK